MDRLGGDRIGLVAFAGETLTYPPTTDYAAVKLFWRDLDPWDMPVGGTADRPRPQGLARSADPPARRRAASRAARSSCCSPTARTTRASRSRWPTRPPSWASRSSRSASAPARASWCRSSTRRGTVKGYVKDADGKYVTSRLAEEMLAQIAQKTGGEYLRADAEALRGRGRSRPRWPASSAPRTRPGWSSSTTTSTRCWLAAGVPAAGGRGLHQRAQAKGARRP